MVHRKHREVIKDDDDSDQESPGPLRHHARTQHAVDRVFARLFAERQRLHQQRESPDSEG